MSHQPQVGGQPATFNTNVNRAKTKKWVEAKSYSYDGDDWGDVDDYDEYGGYNGLEPEPTPTAKPTGLRQRGQSASQMSQDPYSTYSTRQDPYQAPVDTRIHGTAGGPPNRQHQQQYGSRSVTNPQPQTQPQGPAMRRINSFGPENESQAFSAGVPPQSMGQADLGTQSPIQLNQGQNIARHDFQAGQNYPNEHPQSQPSPVQPSVHTPSRPSMDESVRSFGPPQQPTGSYRTIYPDQQLQSNAGGRTQSMASTNSALDFHNRRDFSPSAMPQPLQTRGSPSPHARSSPGHPPRKSSLGQETAPSLPFDAQAPATTGIRNTGNDLSPASETTASGAGKALPFVRPADIYRRMQEERERERQSQESVRPSMDAIMGKTNERPSLGSQHESEINQRSKPTLDPVKERRSEYGLEAVNLSEQSKPEERRPTTSKKFELPNRRSNPSPPGTSSLPQPMLPDVSRVSGFGESFFGSTNDTHEPSQAPFEELSGPTASTSVKQGQDEAAPEKDLKTQPSLGFTSAVHEAFDRAEDQVPPTPNSAESSTVGRSTSGGTSTVSPIMSRGPSTATDNWNPGLPGIDDVTTPTKVDAHSSPRPMSSSSSGTPKPIARKPSPSPATMPQSPDLPSPSFVPGHRRDLSTPSPDNSPARTPALEVNRQLRQPQEVELAAATPTKPSFSANNSSNVSEVSEQEPPSTYPTEVASRGRSDIHVDSQPRAMDLPERSEPASSPIRYHQSYIRTRTDSASSSRVRDLADKFESGSRPESAHSATPRSSVFGNLAQKDDLIPSRPLADRMESFRPHLPGGWESSASIVPAAALRRPESTVDRTRPNSTAATNVPKEEIVSSPVQSPSSVSQSKEASKDAFTAVAAAGTALAGALAAAVGMEQRNEPEASPIENVSDGQRIRRSSEDLGSPIYERSVSMNTTVHPEATKSYLANPMDDEEVSTAAPTPLTKETPLHHGEFSETPDYFPPSDSQEHPGRAGKSDGMAPANHPSMLPSLITDKEGPQYESDRLRREIVRELSPMVPSEPTTAQSDYTNYENTSRLSSNQSLPRPGHESGVLPREYESYWNDANSDDDASHFGGEPSRLEDLTTAHRQQGAAVIGEPLRPRHANQVISSDEPLHLGQSSRALPSDPTTIGEDSQDRPQALQHRFSWEQPLQSPQPIPTDPDIVHEATGSSISELPKPAEPVTVDEASDGPVSDFLKSAIYPEGQPFRLQDPREAPEVSKSLDKADSPKEKDPGILDQGAPFFASRNNSGEHDETADFEKELPEFNPGLEVAPPSLESERTSHIDSGYDNEANYVGQQSIALQSEERQNLNRPILESSVSEPPVREPSQTLSAGDDELLPSPPPDFQPKITAFREILALKSPSERIRAYDDTREQFANQNTGLAHWLAITANDLPEHADLFETSSRRPTFQGHKPSPSRSKFGGLLQSGGLSSQQYPNSTPSAPESAGPLGSTSHYGYSPSGGSSGKISSQQVQAKGKDLLHTAGVFGGKANVAAKGLFSKGKSKLRGSSGAEKAPSAPPQSYDPEPQGMQQQPRIIEAPPTVQLVSRTTVPSNVPIPHDMRAHPDRATVQSDPVPQGESPAVVCRVDPKSNTRDLPYQYEDENKVTVRTPSQEPQPLSQSSGQTSPRDTPSLENYTQSQEGDDERSEESAPITQEHRPRASSLYLKRASHQGQSHPPQAPVTAGENVPDFSKELPSVDSYAGSFKEIQTPRSATSSNKTPTQATFTDASQPAIPAAFRTSTDGTSPWHHRAAGSSPRSFSQSQSGFSAQTSSNSRRAQEPEAGPRFSQDSESTFHTAGSGDGIPETSLSRIQCPEHEPTGHDPYSEILTDRSMLNQSETYQKSLIDSPKKVQDGRTAPLARDSLNSQVLARDYSWKGPSIDSEVGRTNFDHPPSPLTPLQPTNQDVPQQRGPAGPVHYGIDHDFDRPSDTEQSRSRSPSYSRQSQDTRRSQDSRPSIDPNILDHPAFRAVAEGNGMPAQDYAKHLKRGEKSAPLQQTGEHMLVGSGPLVRRRSRSKSQSRRGSRSSAFFKAITSPSRSDPPPLPNAADSQASSSPRNSPAVGDRMSKTFSIFRSRSNHRGSRSGESQGMENMAPRDAPPRGSLTQVGPVAPRPVEEDVSSKGVLSKRNKKLQRASTSSKPEPDSGKKKRFSAIGTLFGGRKRPNSTLQSSVPPQQSFQHSSPVQTQQREPYNSIQPQRFEQNNHGKPWEEYIQPPHEGYYAPSRQTGGSSQAAGSYRSPNSGSRQNGQSYSRAPDAPAYVQDSALRVRQLMSPVERPHNATLPQNTFPQRSPQHSSSSALKSLPSEQSRTGEASSQCPKPQTKASGSSWTRFSTHSRSKSRQEQEQTPSNEALSSPPPKPYAPAPPSNSSTAGRRTFQDPGRSESPPPPPPPPKDDWHRTGLREPSSNLPSSRSNHEGAGHSPSPSQTSSSSPPYVSSQQRGQPLPALQTNVRGSNNNNAFRTSAIGGGAAARMLTPEEKRKSRQLEIERSSIPLPRSPPPPPPPAAPPTRNAAPGHAPEEAGAGDDDDEEPVMSATSFPGQMWQPSYTHWDE